jgi:hypothetical protein
VADLRTTLARLSRGDDRLWPLLCLAAEVAPNAEGEDALDRLIAAGLRVSGGVVRVAAVSADVRVRSYRALSVLETARSTR